jgi:predicted TIM-barrel fold metal-dependent hydrolase
VTERLIVDAHVHVGAWDHADFLGRGADLDETLTSLSAAGVVGAAIMPSDRCENEALFGQAQRAAGRAKLWFFPWVRPGVADDLAWATAHAGEITGLKIHPSLSRMRITDDGFRPYLELAEAHDLVVLLHCGRWAEIAGWAHAIEAAARHPRARFLFAHAGGDTPPNASNAARAVKEQRLGNVWFEFSGLREYWVIERNVALLGADRYLMGSDYPLAHPLMYLGSVAAMALPEADKRKILGENALALFGAPLAA